MYNDFDQTQIDKMTKYIVKSNSVYRHYRGYGLSLDDILEAGRLAYLEVIAKHIVEEGVVTERMIWNAIQKELAKLIRNARKHSNLCVLDEYKEEPLPNYELSPEELVMNIETTQILAQHLDALDDRSQRIIIELYLSKYPKTVEYLAQEFGVTESRIYQLEKEALETLRLAIEGTA